MAKVPKQRQFMSGTGFCHPMETSPGHEAGKKNPPGLRQGDQGSR